MSEILKSCPKPYCGGEIVVSDVNDRKYVQVECQQCLCSVTMPTEDQAIAAWNTRADSRDPAKLDALVEAVKNVVQFLHLTGNTHTANKLNTALAAFEGEATS